MNAGSRVNLHEPRNALKGDNMSIKNLFGKISSFENILIAEKDVRVQALVSNEMVHSTAEIHLINLDKLSAGVPQQMLHEISFKALPAALVDKVEVDASLLKVGDTVKVKDLPIAQNEDINLATDPETTVVIITEVHASADAAADTEQAEQTEDKAEE